MYQKMISYIHLYDKDGEKGQNIGFVKLALQNQTYKLRVQMRNAMWKEKEWTLYGFVRGKELLHTGRFGVLKIKNGFGESLFLGNTGEVFEKYRFIDLGGFLLLERGKEEKKNIEQFCASQWDDEKIEINQVDFRCKPSTENVLHAAELEENFLQQEEVEYVPVYSEGVEVVENVQETENRTEKVEDVKDKTDETKKEDEIQVRERVEQIEENGAEEKERTVEKKSMSIEEKENAVESKQSSEQNLGQRLLDTFFLIKNGKEEKTEVMENEQKEERLDAQQEEEREMDIWEVFQEHKNNLERRYKQIQEEGKEEKNLWLPGEELLRVFPKMNPFFGNEVIESVRMEPKDIGGFPMEFWYLANNSFLLHGYYCYRHLLFMKMHNGAEYQYVIAVPGNSDYREKFMANMFGFEQFKAVQSRENAGFGYWWRRLV
ncbi:MAG: hypothetical protein IIY81_03945 [Lachnospiraceae bacterium]|nr:hypothetical protein [Lachnospiraceae bacterium]